MGACLSAHESSTSRELEKKNAKDFEADSVIKKLLLLGTGESGKSTLFKQMINIYGQGYSEVERRQYVKAVHNNVIGSIKTLIQGCDDESLFPDPKYRVQPALHNLKDTLMSSVTIEDLLTPQIAEQVQKLWNDPAIQSMYHLERSKLQLPDSTFYFMNKLKEVSTPGYIPSHDDILRARVRTTGIIETNFTLNNVHFRIIDVGGQRNERKKWIHCFQEVTAVLFVVALSEYDQVLFEDDSQNRMVEALTLFNEMVNGDVFKKTTMILFLNKRDLFGDKVVRIPINKFFPHFAGGNTFEDGCQFFVDEFMNQNEQPRKVFYHVTCATDPNNVKVVFDSVKETVIHESLVAGGLV